MHFKEGDWIETLAATPMYPRAVDTSAAVWFLPGTVCRITACVHDSIVFELTTDGGQIMQSWWRSASDARKLSALELLALQAGVKRLT